LHTPASVQYGTAAQMRARRTATLNATYAANPPASATDPLPPQAPQLRVDQRTQRNTLIQNE
jgi:hypothetical protein